MPEKRVKGRQLTLQVKVKVPPGIGNAYTVLLFNKLLDSGTAAAMDTLADDLLNEDAADAVSLKFSKLRIVKEA